MLLNLSDLIKKYDLSIKRVIHVGASTGQELETYIQNGVEEVIFFEPQPGPFKQLLANCEKHKDKIKCICHNVALGNTVGVMPMYCEDVNGGQSSSLLKPKQHLKDFPDIKFERIQDVVVTRMDNVVRNKFGIDLINIDVQGYEKEVFKGSEEVLQNVKYIYSEVNFVEMYEGNALVEDLDKFLLKFGFSRVETGDAVNGGWSDAMYINTKFKPRHENEVFVPDEFRHLPKSFYPPDNYIPFEKWFETIFFKGQDIGDRLYLPINWTAYYTNHNYGNDKNAIQKLQYFVDGLPKDKKYFTIVQYDDGILNDISGLDIVVFSSGGRVKQVNKVKNVIIPLMGMDHKFEFPDVKKDIFVSFIGRNTHPLRNEIFAFKRRHQDRKDIFITEELTSVQDYCRILARSKFVISTRGYGATSFRLQEALRYDAIPVYVSDDHLKPFDNDLKGIILRHGELFWDGIFNLKYEDYIEDARKLRSEIFNYEATANLIIKTLNQ